MADSILTDLTDKFKAAVEHETWKSFILNATNDFEFREGIQWSSTEIAELEKRGQPATVENEIKPIIDRIIGQYKSQKARIIYRGRNVGLDETHADILTALSLHIEQQSDYEFEEGDMFDDGQVCGAGCMEVSVDYDDDLTPKIVHQAENILNIFPDPNSKKYDWNKDAEFICRAKWVSFNEAKELYPDYKDEIDGYIGTNPVQNDSQTMERNHLLDERLKRVRIVEVWYKKMVKRKLAISPSYGGVLEIGTISKQEFDKFKMMFSDFKIHEKIEPKIRVGVFLGNILLEDKDSPYNHNLFPFVPYFVYRRKNGEPYSMVRMLKDPQMEINKRRSKALHLLNSRLVLYEEGAVTDKDMLAQEMRRPDGQLEYKKGYQFQMADSIELAATQMQLQQESKLSMSRVSGVSDEAMARKSEIRSGIGLQRKQMMTDIITMPIFDNLRRSRMMIGKLRYELIKQFYNEEKIFAVTDDMNQTKHYAMTMDVIKTIKEGIYDVIIEEAPNTTTIQEEQFAYLAELVKGLGIPPNVGVALLPIFIRLSQLKNKDEVAQIMEGLQQMPPEHPKTSLNLVWSELYPEEKATFAQMMGFPELAQIEMQRGGDPQHIVKAKSDMAKTGINVPLGNPQQMQQPMMQGNMGGNGEQGNSY